MPAFPAVFALGFRRGCCGWWAGKKSRVRCVDGQDFGWGGEGPGGKTSGATHVMKKGIASIQHCFWPVITLCLLRVLGFWQG